jgi:hypothetical protein
MLSFYNQFIKRYDRSTLYLLCGIIFCISYTALVFFLKPYLPELNFSEDTGFAHYYWKLPDPNFWTHFTAWTGYFFHQLSVWYIIYLAQSAHLTNSKRSHKINFIALFINAFFVLLHLIHTHVWYDGLAQDVHILSSQGAVIILLVIVLIMENQRRGIVFGKKINFISEAGHALRKYHGYIFSWAVIYTFWYHPMETTVGHLIGTFYTCMIMLQGCLMYTRIHSNKFWTFFLEICVVFHGATVAMMQQNGLWGMFLFGFLSIFIITQMHGLGLSKRIRWFFVGLYTFSAIFAYNNFFQGSMFAEIPRIPAVEYGLVFLFSFLIWFFIRLTAFLSKSENKKNYVK